VFSFLPLVENKVFDISAFSTSRTFKNCNNRNNKEIKPILNKVLAKQSNKTPIPIRTPSPEQKQFKEDQQEQLRNKEASDPNTLPFFVSRTKNARLPVYTEYRNGGTRKLTVLRKYRGDVNALKRELIMLCNEEITEKVGSLVIKGLHGPKVVQWLESKGF